jgi:prepilin peptidase CpaA
VAYALSVWAGWVAWVDWRQQRVPNVALVLVLVPALLCLLWNRHGLLQLSIADSLFGLLVAGGVLLPGYAMGRMGAGDVKFSALLGLVLGSTAALKMLLVFGVVLGLLSALALWRFHRQPQSLKRRIAAAPALAVGFMSQLFADGISGLLS